MVALLTANSLVFGNKLDDGNNYRPISVLPTFSKTLESPVHNQCMSYLNRNTLLTEAQTGFREDHSTGTCLAAILQLHCMLSSTLIGWIRPERKCVLQTYISTSMGIASKRYVIYLPGSRIQGCWTATVKSNSTYLSLALLLADKDFTSTIGEDCLLMFRMSPALANFKLKLNSLDDFPFDNGWIYHMAPIETKM